MNDLKIMEYIAATPDARAVQVADKFDVELVDASNALRALVEVGDLVRTQGTAPNGQSVQVYNLSPEFKKTTDGKAILQRLAATAATTTQPGAEDKSTGAAPLPAALVDQMSKAGQAAHGRRGAGSRLERAVDFITANGKATNDQLRALLDMKSFEYPSTVLRSAINDGRVARDGEDWVKGTGQPPEKQRPPYARKPAAPPSLARPPAAAPVQPVQDTGLRCGIWSDGMIELQRGAKTICILNKDEAQFLATHFNSFVPADGQG